MTPSDSPIVPDWKWGTPEGSRELDRLLDRRLTFREKLVWLEEAETLSLRLQASRERLLARESAKGSGASTVSGEILPGKAIEKT